MTITARAPAPVSLVSDQSLRVCLRRGPGKAPVERAATWQLEAADADGARMFLSERVPLPGAGQFRCAELRHEQLPTSVADDLLEIGLGVILEPGNGAHGLLPSTQMFEGAAPATPLAHGVWVGQDAAEFLPEFNPPPRP